MLDARRCECSERALGGEREVSSSSRENELLGLFRAARPERGRGRLESANDSYVSPFLSVFALSKTFARARNRNHARKPQRDFTLIRQWCVVNSKVFWKCSQDR